MDARRLERCRRRLNNRLPLVGTWLRRRSVQALLRDGSTEAAVLLAEAANSGSLDGATGADAVDRWPAPSRALFYFLAGQWPKYDVLDFDHQMLRALYESGDEALRRRIMVQARAGGRLDWVDVAAGGHAARRLGEMTDNEWQTALAVLEEREQWDRMWELAQRAPPRWSAQLLQRLGQCGWQPPEPEQAVFAELVVLAQRWQEPDLATAVQHLKTLEGHTDLVDSLAISPDGRLLASASLDHTVRLWGLPEGRHLKTLVGHTGSVLCLAISPDGGLLASGSADKTVRLWGLPEGRHLKTLEGHIDWVTCLAISPDGRLLASGSRDEAVRLWALREGQHLKTLKGHTHWVTCLAISPDGRLLASGGDDTVRLWGLPEGQHLKTLEGHTGYVECLTITPDGRLLASGSWDKTVRLWGLPEGQHLKTLEGQWCPIKCLAISPDGWLLASGSADKTVQLWGVGLYRLASLPVQEASPQHLVLAQAALQDGQLSEAQRRSLEFIAALLRWQMRFAMQVQAAPRRISAGEFDIEIEG